LHRVDQAAADGFWAVGFVAYEAAPGFDPAFRNHQRVPHLPLAWFGLFGAPREVDPAVLDASAVAARRAQYPADALVPTVSEDAYLAAVASVRERIAQGETYQANLTYRLRGRLDETDTGGLGFSSSALSLFHRLASLQDGAYATFLELDDLAICSASPELFFERSGQTVVCRPMKGTAARGATPAADRVAAVALRASAKERAENLMIVDMIRNDLGRVACAGSVQVPELFRVERYPTLFQMTSEVRATSEAPLPELFGALFPCASITGAPKVRTMEILAGLETTPRGVYTGALGIVAPGGDARFSVAIRTAVIWDDGRGPGFALEYGTGSGIVWDSVAERELDETRTKALLFHHRPAPSPAPGQAEAPREPEDAALRLLETLLWRPAPGPGPAEAPATFGENAPPNVATRSVDATASDSPRPIPPDRPLDLPGGAGFVLLDRHLARLTTSAAALGFALDPARVREALVQTGERLAHRRPVSEYRVRLLVDRHGDVETEAVALGRPELPRAVALAIEPIDETDPLLRHKTTRRALYEQALERVRSGGLPVDDVILWNRQGEVTETTIANLVVQVDGHWVTPTLSCGLLPGTFRAELLERGVLRESRLSRGALRRATALALVSSVRGWLPARLVATDPGLPVTEDDAPRVGHRRMPRHGKAG